METLIRMAAAAAVVVAAVWGATSFRRQGVYAVLEAADGSLYRIDDGGAFRFASAIASPRRKRFGQTTQTERAGARGRLARRNAIDVRALVGSRRDGLKIRLDTGSIIVSAAKQPGGRLYVQTRDMTASVTGTTLWSTPQKTALASAAIEGEVEVREGTTEKDLRPVSRSRPAPSLATRPLSEDIAGAATPIAFAESCDLRKGMADTAGPLQPLNYAEVCSGAQGRASAAVATVRGSVDQAVRSGQCPPAPPGARGGGANSFYMSPGRTYVLCMTLATIIRTAYQLRPLRNLGTDNSVGPAAAASLRAGLRSRRGGRQTRQGRSRLDPRGALHDRGGRGRPADGEAMSGPMLRALLEKRFQLKAHVETEQAPAFDLTVARGGLKIKPVDPATACEAGPPPDVPAIRIRRTFKDVRNGQKPSCGLGIQPNGPNRVIVGGAAPLQALANALGGPLGLGVRVFDKTGSADRFNFVLEVLDETPPERRIVLPDPDNHPETAADVPRAANIFSGLEDQLGLRLVPSKASRPFVVIDHVERPSAN
jgi:uncharacterized protein (TIGR03435 family)